jgi:6-pyruvoyltetrahydropterin/6-carboxytetrahydropterin synthase
MFELSQDFVFEAAHTLTRAVPVDEFEASRRIHGHSYTATVAVSAADLTDRSQVVDLFYLRKAIAEVRLILDHRFLDEVDGLGAPTLENLCTFIYDRVTEVMPEAAVSKKQHAPMAYVCAVTVRRPSSGDACTYRREVA